MLNRDIRAEGFIVFSGTEPKIKYYSELRGSSEEQARKDLDRVVQAIGDELVEYQKNGLEWRR